jgi:hypothetical protein
VHVFFVHCDRCHSTLRAGSLDSNDLDPEASADLESFHATHAACSLRLFEPTGRAMASGPWHEPMTERWLEVRDRDGLGVAIGSRRSVDEPLNWRIERMGFEEEVEVALDRELFWDAIERTVHPLPMPQRQVSAWANHVDNHLRTLGPADWVILYDDTRCPDQSAGCLTLTARSPVESTMRSFGFPPEVVQRLATLFNDMEFPPIRITRKITMRPTRRAPRFGADARLDSPDPLV